MENKLDTILRKQLPIYEVPKYGEFEPIAPNQSRLLLCGDSLCIESSRPWGHTILPLWYPPKSLLRGTVEFTDGFTGILDNMLQIIRQDMLPEATRYADKELEWGGWIIYNPEKGFIYEPLEFDKTIVSINVGHKKLKPGEHLICDVHSHHRMRPYFSEEDETSDTQDSSRTKISIVLGNYNSEEFEFVYRYVIAGFPLYPAGGNIFNLNSAAITAKQEEPQIEE